MPPPREHRERHEDERRDRDGAAAREHAGREVVARSVLDELVAVVPERALQLHRRRLVRDGLARDRQQRERDGGRRHADRAERRGDAPRRARLREKLRDEPARERNAEERRIRRVHERERGGRDGRGDEQRAPQARARTRSTSASTAGTSSCRAVGAGRTRSGYVPPCPAAKPTSATCAAAAAPASAAESKSAYPASYATTTAIGRSSALSCWTTSAGSTPASFDTAARNACQSGNA